MLFSPGNFPFLIVHRVLPHVLCDDNTYEWFDVRAQVMFFSLFRCKTSKLISIIHNMANATCHLFDKSRRRKLYLSALANIQYNCGVGEKVPNAVTSFFSIKALVEDDPYISYKRKQGIYFNESSIHVHFPTARLGFSRGRRSATSGEAEPCGGKMHTFECITEDEVIETAVVKNYA